jgi:ATP-dependent helicase/DNAse subunit B
MVGRKLDAENTTWLTQLDNLLADHFPVRLGDHLPQRVAQKFEIASDVASIIQSWLADFRVPQQTICEWSQAFARCLEQLYEDRLDLPGRERTAMAVEKAKQVLERFADLNAHLDMSIDSAAAMEMLTGRLSDVRFGEVLQDDDVEIAGWLDLALDTSPALIVVGMNHPFVPATVTSDPFLPGALRTKLRMADNDRRYARDAYAAHLMASTRRDTCFIVGQMSADGSPTPPSRLIAAAPPKDSARRVLQLLDSQREPVEVDHRWNNGPQHTDLPIPKLDARTELQEINSISVTAFGDYLTCPYRFYLRHVLRCRPLDDSGRELAANQFGDLIHNALDLYGNDLERRDESNPEKIKSLMIEYLHDYARDRYGDSATTSVALQVAQAERRLDVVAQRQAERIANGWRIRHAEISAGEKQGSGLEVDGQWMTINGRIDRIDHHPETGRWAILDYKTHGTAPEKTHFKKTNAGIEWHELQLPLYRIMAPHLGIDVDPIEIELGYFNISQKDSETKINIADFGEVLMRQAKDEILRCIRDIRAGKFEPTEQPVQYDDYAMILQTGVAN